MAGSARASFDDADLDELQRLLWRLVPPSDPPAASKFDLAKDRFCDYRAIGEELGISAERVRQVERSALKKLRFWLEFQHGSLEKAANILLRGDL